MHWKDRQIPNNIFKVIELSCADDLLKLRNLSSAYLFRGQNNASWELETSLERYVKKNQSSPSNESNMIRAFQRRAHIYTKDIPDYNNTIEWLALMQHYGCPTRLLDFSISLFIGAYFAVDNYNDDDDAALWCINQIALYHIYKDNPNLHFLASDNGRPAQDNVNRYLNETDRIDGIISIEPFKMNERLMVQQGAFILPLNTNKTFECNLFATFGVSSDIQKDVQVIKFADTDFNDIIGIMLKGSIIKLVIPQKVKKDISSFLRQTNIEPQYLFPGLEGLAKSQIFLLDGNSSFRYSK